MPPIVIIIEGSIGAGKTTFLNWIEKNYKPNTKLVVVREPIEEWTNHLGKNLLMEQFKTSRSSIILMWKIMSDFKYMMLNVVDPASDTVYFFERSAWSAVHVFGELAYRDGRLSEHELGHMKYILEREFNLCTIDMIVNIRVDHVAIERIKNGGRLSTRFTTFVKIC